MRTLQATLLLLSTVLFAGCGVPQPGEACEASGYLCYSGQAAMECRLGEWRKLPCRGPGGCKVVSGKVNCDMSQNVAGDACGASTENQGICAPTGDATLQCRQGVMVKTNDCTSCTVGPTEVICQQ